MSSCLTSLLQVPRAAWDSLPSRRRARRWACSPRRSFRTSWRRPSSRPRSLGTGLASTGNSKGRGWNVGHYYKVSSLSTHLPIPLWAMVVRGTRLASTRPDVTRLFMVNTIVLWNYIFILLFLFWYSEDTLSLRMSISGLNSLSAV